MLIVFPDADLAVLVSGENHVFGEGDGFGGARGSCFGVEGVEIGTRVTIVDVDLVLGCGVEEVVLESEGGNGARRVRCEGGETVVGDGEVVEALRREFLERRNGGECLYGVVAMKSTGSAVIRG